MEEAIPSIFIGWRSGVSRFNNIILFKAGKGSGLLRRAYARTAALRKKRAKSLEGCGEFDVYRAAAQTFIALQWTFQATSPLMRPPMQARLHVNGVWADSSISCSGTNFHSTAVDFSGNVPANAAADAIMFVC